jgi:hypothetical protein
MSDLILLLLSAYGLSFFITHKLNWLDGRLSILDRLMECSFCMGFHSGWLVYLVWCCLSGHDYWEMAPLFGFASASFSYVLDAAVVRLER